MSRKQLDTEPQTATKGSIRQTFLHLSCSQAGYLSINTGMEHVIWHATPSFSEIEESVITSGIGLLALTRDESKNSLTKQLQTNNGYLVEPWLVIVQVINHAHGHREQIISMLSALGLTLPALDGWTFGEVTNALISVPKEKGH